MFKWNFWSQYQPVLDGEASTNNQLESFNRVFNRMTGTFPNIWKMMEAFNKTEADTHRILLSNAIGQDLTCNTGRKKAHDALHKKIRSIVSKYASLNHQDYLQQIAHLLGN